MKCLLTPSYAEKIMRQATENFQGRNAANLRYADDVLLARYIQELQDLISSVIKKSEEVGLYLKVS